MTGHAPVRRVRSWFGFLGRSIIDLYRRGFSLFRVAPAVLALVAIPEFMQHAVEIRLGMFDSREMARAVSNDPQRWAFGYAKLAGLMLTILAAARFWWTREHGGRWYDVREIAWGRLMIGLLIWGGVPFLAEPLDSYVGTTVKAVLMWTLSLLVLPFLFLVLSGLFGDRQPTLQSIRTRGWPSLLLLCVLLPLAFAPAQWLHGYNHTLALGSERVVIWALMLFDSLLVGLLAGLTGTALYLGYAAFRRSTVSA